MKPFIRVLFAASVAGVLSRCHGDPHATNAKPAPSGPRPDASACSVDTDCTFGFGLDSDDCCYNTNGPGAGPQSVAFATWARARTESSACAHVKCAPMASPFPPPPGCASEPRCQHGRCGSAC